MDMVERVARALVGGHPNRVWESLSHESQERWKFSARAAITAMREPTEVMTRAGDAWQAHCGDSDSLFSEMIQAALSESGE